MKKSLYLILGLLLAASTPNHAALHSVGLDKSFYTSDFMIGDAVVAVIFPESDGSLDPNIENWSESRKAQVLQEIMTGHDWWVKQNPNSHLSFTYVTQTISTKYEPITRPYFGEALWVPDVMSKLGYSGSRFTSTRDYVNDLRETYDTDWGFVVFVVDSLIDSNGKFSDGYFAYAYLGGPFMVMTYDNNGYGIDNMDVVSAHETGHIFHALDEYAGASSPADYSHGYFVTVNGNHAFSPIANEPNSIMRGGLRWGLSAWARQMIGWRDINNNGRDDIVDLTTDVNLSNNPTASEPEDPDFIGQASLSVLPRQGDSQGRGLTVDKIAKVNYRIGSGKWIEAIPTDGTFDSAQESFQIVIDASELSGSNVVAAQDVEIRIDTFYSMSSGGGSGPSVSATSLNDAHPFPNPFKPNSSLGHVNVTFTNLTAGAKLQIFTAAGEPVFEKKANSSATTIQWTAVNDQGSKVASGVYFYLISNDNGETKKGKLAVIR